ncbi:MAG: glycosyltransferase [Deltaproteobacteria bacterium]|jgi:spore maturation protein CgeB|nr:glycosyltransferase [Deltaproteobacteria bacterium]
MKSWFNENIGLLRVAQPLEADELGRFPPRPIPSGQGFAFGVDGGTVILETGPRGHPFLRIAWPGLERRLSSALDPEGEDRALVERFFAHNPGASQGLTVLGLGLGFLLDPVLERLAPKSPLMVLEARPELAAAALTASDLSRAISRPGFRLVLGPALDLPAGAPSAVLARPANLRLDPALYPKAKEPRPASRPPRILFLDTGYFLGREITRAARAQGAEVSVWTGRAGEVADGADYRRLLGQIRDFRPGMVLTVNHLGFDADGLLAETLSRLGLPMASWFVDSPAFILGQAPKPKGDFFVFCWDKDYLPVMADLGYRRAFFLPLASDDGLFRPGPATGPARPLAFVGDSLAAATRKYLRLSGLDESSLPTVDALAREFLENHSLIPGPDLAGLDLGLDPAQRLNLQALITWRASRLWRQSVLSALPVGQLSICGDEGWAGLVGGASLCPGPDYYGNLPAHYRSTGINLNITSAQMKGGLNQRVFDVPACRAFLLTDRRAQIDDLFAPGEVATYGCPAEAAEKASWYLKRPGARARMAEKAHRRVLGEHLYVHRLDRLSRTVMGDAR